MTTEEKAKAYDEALKVLHKYDGANIMFSQSLKEEMFPELKESEDEKVINLDEATGALDIKMKREVQNILLKILNNSEKTILNVTHSVEGAVYLSTKIVILLPKPCIIYKTMDIRFDGEPPRDKWIFSINQFIEYSKELTEYLEKVCSM